MSLPGLATRRPVTFLMMFIGLVAIGVVALLGLRLNLFPDVELPTVAVITSYPGVAPEDIETLITRPLEEGVASVQNLEDLSSTSQAGLSIVIAEFAWGANLALAEQDVRNAIDLTKPVLPSGANEPLVIRFDPSLIPVMGVSVAGEKSMQKLRLIAEKDIEPRLERIEGVAGANTSGGLVREIQVQVDREMLAARGLSLERLIGAIQRENVVIPAGFIEENSTEYTIRTLGEYTGIDQIARTIVTFQNGIPIYVDDVAEVVDGVAEQRAITRVNNQPAVVITIQRASGANTVEVTKQILAELEAIERALPGITLTVVFEEAEIVEESINNLLQTIMLAVLLCGLVLLLFLRSLRTTLVVLLSIPVSIVSTFMVMSLFDVSLNVVSMGGLALGVGLFVDNSIVVLESIFRHRERGEPAAQGSVVGAAEVSTAITASTLTTVCVFFPLLFVPGISGQMFRDLSLTVVFSLLISLFVSLTLIPLAASRIVRMVNVEDRGFGLRIGELIRRAGTVHGRMLDWSLSHRKTLLIAVAVVFVVSLFAASRFIGFEFMPQTDYGSLSISLKGEVGTNLSETDKLFRRAEELVSQNVPELETMYTSIGSGGGMFSMGGEGTHAGSMTLELVDQSKRRRSTAEVEIALRKVLTENLPDVDIAFSEGMNFMGGGEANRAVVKIYGYDIAGLFRMSQAVETLLRDVPGAEDIESSLGGEGRPQIAIAYDRERMYDLGLSTSQVSGLIQTAILGTVTSAYKEGGREYDILVRLKAADRLSVEDIKRLRINTPSGVYVTLADVADLSYERAPVTILREDQQRIATVSFRAVGRPLGSVVADIEPLLAQLDWPAEYGWEIGGSAEDLEESLRWLVYALIVGMGLVYMVMAAQFESFRNPFIIFLTIPLAGIGVVWLLLATGTTINIFSMVGLIVLVGIVINNSIVLIDYINLLRLRDRGLLEATREAARVRFRPVLMTALTTILAMLPLALQIGAGAETWGPMARSVIGGLLAGTFSTLLVIPVLYTIFEGGKEKRKAQGENSRRE